MAEDFAKVFRDSFGIDCEAGDLFGARKVRGDEYNKFKYIIPYTQYIITIPFHTVENLYPRFLLYPYPCECFGFVL